MDLCNSIHLFMASDDDLTSSPLYSCISYALIVDTKFQFNQIKITKSVGGILSSGSCKQNDLK